MADKIGKPEWPAVEIPDDELAEGLLQLDAPPARVDCGLLVKIPFPWMEFLHGDGQLGRVREGQRTSTIWFADGKWKMSLHAKDIKACAFLTADTIEELFAFAERGLRRNDLGWKPDRKRTQ